MSDVQRIDAIKELEENVKNIIILETQRTINANMGCYRDKMLSVCILLNMKYGIKADGIQRILDSINDYYVFYLMHGSEYAHWIALGVNCQKYAEKRTIYVAQNYDKLKS